MSWLGCTRQCKKNRKQHHIQNQSKFLPWYLINGLECTVQNISISLNSLFELHMKSKKQVKYQQNLLLKKEKAIITETLHLVTNVFEDDSFSRKVLEKKDQVSASKGVHKQRLQLAKVFVTCKNFMLLQRKTPKCKYWVLKVLCLETQIVCSGWLKNDSLCLRMKRSSKCCAACRCNGRRLDIQRPDQINFVLP